jgi:predicted TIM-barrel fold metal-dependent hydrolase
MVDNTTPGYYRAQAMSGAVRDQLVESLVTEMAGMTVIDAHEHLPREEELLAEPADIFTRLFGQYSPSATASAGLADARTRLKDTKVPLEERWRLFRPYSSAIRDTGFVRSALRAAKDFFGVEEITDQNYQSLSEKIRKADVPGIYDRILKGTCRIERIINQGSWKDDFTPGMYRPFMYLPETDARDITTIYRDWEAGTSRTLLKAEEWARAWCADIAAQGYIGLKFAASIPPGAIEDAEAESLYRKLLHGSIDDREAKALGIWLMHASIRIAPEHRFIVAIHCGLNWEVYMDLSDKSPMRVVPLLLRYRSTTFDLYHAGIPWVREMGIIGNQYPNANLNLCWTHQGSPYMTEHMLNEWIDVVPSNKIIGFGGDVSAGPYKVYGALCFARENIARALAVRIRRGQMTQERAVDLCRRWLYDNPKRIYGLK